jgi:ribokinase
VSNTASGLPTTTTLPVVVVGSLNADVVMRVPAIPRPGETVLATSVETRDGGKGGNQACAAARLGAPTTMIGCVGADDAGKDADAGLRAAGVDVSALQVGNRRTGTATVLVADDGENVIVVDPGANALLSPEYVRDVLERFDDAVVLISLEIPPETAIAAAVRGAERGFTVVVNPAPAHPLAPELLRACDILVPNQHEVDYLGVVDVAALLRSGPGVVVVTHGRRGADVWRADREPHHQAAFPVDAADTTGAGDAFCGGLAWALARGDDVDRAVLVGAAAGALATRATGARSSLPGPHDIDRLIGRG